ncbi:phosphotransferase [Halovenus sp. WSH3]|uniref:Phosphotransferase n=1 Tax=Halovenus carboxidivorans TaxID=2692199 RepID=A0A6B0TCK5_9EURY|nr:phosphotransferase [Halovenus carboxidivorans]
MSSPERDIEAVLDESGPDYDSFSYERPTAGHQGEVFMVSLKVGGETYEVVVKFQAGDPDFALEPFLHEYVADRTDVPVPRILVFKRDPELDVEPYFVTERIRGENLAASMGELDRPTRERVIAHTGRTLGDMHANIGFEGFGRLALDEDDQRLIVDEFSWDWQAFFTDLVESYIDRLADTPFADLQDQAREYIDSAIDCIESTGPPRLVHDDFRPANLLFDPTETAPITAVLDWQLALAADPEYHIARTEFLFIDPAFQDAAARNRLRKQLYDGYREHLDFDPAKGFEQRRAVYYFATLLWRMLGFEAAFDDARELAQGRAEVRFRQQFDQLATRLP